ncbi:hypothetical protein [Streptomyces lydicus]|uniref:hypothetical protein n=1 Tax=Streptomyces lydicus TaxID=47763 RepID=UPI0037AF2594
MPQPPSPTPFTITHAWRTIADGLLIQRAALHIEHIKAVVRDPGLEIALFKEAAPSALSAVHTPQVTPEAQEYIALAELGFWIDVPQEYGTVGANPLHPAAGIAYTLIGEEDNPQHPALAAVEAVAAAAAWWVGAFATVRHLGVHHRRLNPITTPTSLATLSEAVQAVTIGIASRILTEAARTAPDDETVRRAWCRAITEGIVREPSIQPLLDNLEELRLVDLVTLYTPWRGQFTKYAAGTGAGQVE